MSTRATIGYEAEDGSYVGVYCHYDGDPDSIVPILKTTLWQEVKDNVERALVEGGLRSVEGWETYAQGFPTRGEESARTRWLMATWPCTENRYNYRVRLDGTIDYINYRGEVIPV